LNAKRVALFALPVMNMLIWLLFSCRSNSFMAVSSAYKKHTSAKKKQWRARERSFQPMSDANAILSSRPSTTLFTLFPIGREKWISQSLLTLHLLLHGPKLPSISSPAACVIVAHQDYRAGSKK